MVSGLAGLGVAGLGVVASGVSEVVVIVPCSSSAALVGVDEPRRARPRMWRDDTPAPKPPTAPGAVHCRVAGPEDKTAMPVRELDRTARWGLWALPVWTVLLFFGTLTHQPDPRTEFAGFARYVTTTEFLLSHLVASILGAAIGVLGLMALFIFLALRVRSRLAAAGLVMAVVGNVLITAIFGMAAFAQSAV